jgi:cytoskeletal protein CcmA (bactofilin family)
MFTKPNELSAESPRETNGAGHRDATPSILSADLKVVGNLECAGDVQVEGRIEGDIRSQSVTVGEGADVRGSIFAERVRIGGTVQGEISAPVIVIAKSAKVRGDIVHETLTVEAGAFVEGQVRRLDTKAATAATAAPRPAAKPAKPDLPKIVETPPAKAEPQAAKSAAH